MERVTQPLGQSAYVALKLLQNICEVDFPCYDQNGEDSFRNLMRLLNLMMRGGAYEIRYPPMREDSDEAERDMIIIYFDIFERFSVHSRRGLLCLFTATYNMMMQYRYQIRIARRLATFFAHVSRDFNSWEFFSRVNYDNIN